MGKQYNKTEKRTRGKAYKQRCKAREKEAAAARRTARGKK